MCRHKLIELQISQFEQFQEMDGHKEDPRATRVVNNSKDEQEVTKAVQQIQDKKNTTVFYVLSKFIELPAIKNEPEFIDTLFEDNINVIAEMIDWMLIPKHLIKQKKIKSNVEGYPYNSKEFMKQNWCFYEQLYLNANNGKLPLNVWFKFLQDEYYDSSTIQTALGYFSEVFIPFAKYEFSESTNLNNSVDLNSFTANDLTFGIMKLIKPELLQEIIPYCRHTAIYQFLTTAILMSIEDPNDSEISENALLSLLESAQKDIVFPLKGEEQKKQFNIALELLENIAITLKEAINNIDPGNVLSHRIQTLVRVILKSNIIIYASDTVTQSRLCNMECKPISQSMKLGRSKSIEQDFMSLSQPIAPTSPGTKQLSQSKQYVNVSLEDCENQQDFLQVLLKILTYTVDIYIKIPKYLQSGEVSDISIFDVSLPSNSTNPRRSLSVGSEKDLSHHIPHKEEYQAIMSTFQKQMQEVLDNLPKMNELVYQHNCLSVSTKTIKFSSGQNIKPITFMKFQYFKLLHSCLIMIHVRNIDVKKNQSSSLDEQTKRVSLSAEDFDTEDPLRPDQLSTKVEFKNADGEIVTHTIDKKKPLRESGIFIEPFIFDIEKLYLIEVIEKYLSENRWNNIVHRVLQKIFHLLVMRDYQYLRKNVEKDRNKKLTESFLSYLIENFTQRDYIFLDTFKFTTQGNLHSLYNISKDLAYTLNGTNQLVILLNEFEPWKKFILNDLKVYEEKTYPEITLPDKWDGEPTLEPKQSFGLKVDEADSIRKLIDNISVAQKWPSRAAKSNFRSVSKSGGVFRNSGGEVATKTDDYMSRSHGAHMNRKSYKFPEGKKTLDDLLKKKIEFSVDGDTQSQIKQFEVEDISVRQKIAQTKMVKSQIVSSTVNEESLSVNMAHSEVKR